MKIAPTIVRDKLRNTVKDMDAMKELFVKDPESDFTRERSLPFKAMINMMLKFGGASLQNEISNTFIPPEKHPYACIPTKSAFIQQRNKILPEAGYVMLRSFSDDLPFLKKFDGKYRLLACDGSDIPIPHNDEEMDYTVVTRTDRKSYNMLHFNGLFDILNRIFVDCIIDPGIRAREREALNLMASHLPERKEVIVLADRGYSGFNCIAHLIESRVKFAVRTKDIDSNGLLRQLNLPDGEFDLDISKKLVFKKPKGHENDDNYVIVFRGHFDYLEFSKDSYNITFRVVRFKLPNGSFECIVTNLPRDEFPPERLRRLYHLRWRIENAYRDLKYTVDMLHFHGKSASAVLLEVYCSIILFNYAAYIAVHCDPLNHSGKTKYRYKVNFANAVDPCRKFFHGSIGECELLHRLKLAPTPIRDGRCAPRPSRLKEQSSREFNYRAS